MSGTKTPEAYLGSTPEEHLGHGCELDPELGRGDPLVSPTAAQAVMDAWSLPDVLTKLADAADILFDRHNYDGDGYEQVAAARDVARVYAATLSEPAPPDEESEALEALARAIGEERSLGGKHAVTDAAFERVRAAMVKMARPTGEAHRLRAVLLAANNALVEADLGDHEHQIAFHADTLPVEHRRVAGAAERALDILSPVVAEMVEPSGDGARDLSAEAASRLLSTLRLHGNYPLYYRCNMAAILAVLDVLAPEAAKRLRAGEDPDDIRKALFPDIDDDEFGPEEPAVRLSPEDAARVRAKMEALADEMGIEADERGLPRLSEKQVDRFVDLITKPGLLLEETRAVPMAPPPEVEIEEAVGDIPRVVCGKSFTKPVGEVELSFACEKDAGHEPPCNIVSGGEEVAASTSDEVCDCGDPLCPVAAGWLGSH